MPQLPTRFAALILAFAPLFVHRSWRHARVLLIGAILTPGRRTVASVLRITGRSRERRFVNYHRVLSRAAWCPRTGARTLLGLLVDAFVPSGPVILALDDTNERRWGRRIKGRGIYRDPVRSSDGHFVKTSGLPVVPIRWVLIRDPEHRFAPQALLCTDLARDPAQIVAWFVRRWCVEVTVQEARAHLGVETQRQMVRQGSRPDHALPARPVLDRHPAGCPPCGPRASAGCGGSMVPQSTAHLQRCARRRAPDPLARAGFGNVAPQNPGLKTPPRPAGALGLRPLPRRLNG